MRLLLRPSDEEGYTLVELLITLIMTSTFVTLLMYFTFQYWRYAFSMAADQDTMIQRLNAGDFIRETLGTSSGTIIQNSIPDTNVLAPDPVDGTGNYWLPIHAIPGAKTASNGMITPLVYFRRPSVNTTNAIIMNGTQPYNDEYVIYIDGTAKKVYVRSLSNSFAADNKLKTSCPPAIATASCPADRELIADVSSVTMRYFSRTGNLIDWTSLFDSSINEYIGPDFPVVEVVEMTLQLQKKPVFQQSATTQNSTVIRIALRNK